MPTRWYTADLHLGHDAIIRLSGRPFRSAAHMDAVLIENLWARVGADDALWVVGDFAHGPKAKDRRWLEQTFAKLPGREHHLVVGNHDGEATRALPWTSVTRLAEVADEGVRGPPAVLCHYPMITWHRARKGALHLFGHVHGRWQGARGAVNVGVDQWGYVPVTLGCGTIPPPGYQHPRIRPRTPSRIKRASRYVQCLCGTPPPLLPATGWPPWRRPRGTSLDKLMEELSARAFAEHDTELRFRLRAASGDPRGPAILGDLDERFGGTGPSPTQHRT